MSFKIREWRRYTNENDDKVDDKVDDNIYYEIDYNGDGVQIAMIIR